MDLNEETGEVVFGELSSWESAFQGSADALGVVSVGTVLLRTSITFKQVLAHCKTIWMLRLI